jgi:hypothetical protein
MICGFGIRVEGYMVKDWGTDTFDSGLRFRVQD